MKGIARDVLDFCGTEVLGINLDDDLSSLHIDTLLIDAFTSPSAITQLVGRKGDVSWMTY